MYIEYYLSEMSACFFYCLFSFSLPRAVFVFKSRRLAYSLIQPLIFWSLPEIGLLIASVDQVLSLLHVLLLIVSCLCFPVVWQEPVVQKCLSCLKEAVAGQLDNLYTSALLSYTFTLAGDQEMRSKLVTYLHQKSNTQGKMTVKPSATSALLAFQLLFSPNNFTAVINTKKAEMAAFSSVEIVKQLKCP